ncbi:NAD-dependent epimerase/dehydratase family protein [bacterium]|nr:NAD-dependent epimerase/dehydratase family protein [bacterium]
MERGAGEEVSNRQDSPGKCFLVTGGGGFLGKALVKRLILDGHRVKSLSRGRYEELDSLGVVTYQYDLGSEAPLPEGVLDGVEGVFHTAALVKMWGPRQAFVQTNIEGTRRLLDACRKAEVSRFVYTSSPSVIADGTDLNGVDESYPYPRHFEAFYPETKAAAEQIVLSASDQDLRCCSLRPHLIFGPGDTNLIPTVVQRARAGSLRRIGRGENLVDFSYIEDCVEAHICAMSALCQPSSPAAGRAYFVSQGDPYPLWRWIDTVLKHHSLPPVTRSIPYPVARSIAALLEFCSKTFPFLGEPRLTTFLVNEMYTSHYFDIGAARRDLGYVPRYTVEEALARTFSRASTSSSGTEVEPADGRAVGT